MRWTSLITGFLEALTAAARALPVWVAHHVTNQIATLENQIYETEAAAAPDAGLVADRLRLQLAEKRRLLALIQPAGA